MTLLISLREGKKRKAAGPRVNCVSGGNRRSRKSAVWSQTIDFLFVRDWQIGKIVSYEQKRSSPTWGDLSSGK